MTPKRDSAVEHGRLPTVPPADEPPDDAELSRADGAPGAAIPEPARPEGSALPRWYQVGVVAASVLVATVGSFGLLLAINGWYRTWLVLVVAVPLTAVLTVVLWRGQVPSQVSRAGQVGAALALVIAVGYAAFAGATPSQHMIVNRDPAAYQVAGRWIAESGSIDVDARGDAFEGIDGLVYRGAATYNVPPVKKDAQGRTEPASGNVQIQFNHLTSAVLAAAYDVGGPRLFFRVPAMVAALGLLLVYALAVKASRRPLLSLAAPLLLAVSMPLLYVARDTFSEPFALVLLWGGMLVLCDAHDRPRPWVGVVGGVLLGGVAAARVDALVYVIVMFPLAAASIAAARSRDLRRSRSWTWGVAVATTLLVSAIGWVDLTRHSGSYADDLRADLDRLRLAVVASVVVSTISLALWLALPPLRRAARRLQRPAAWIGGAVIILALAALWLLRPELEKVKTRGLLSTTAGIQRRDGLTVEARSYAESSMRWMAWYLGVPALVAAIGGLGLAAWQTIRTRATAATAAVAAVTLAGGAVYWWDPSITPSQPWASRRFVPAVFPGLTVMVVVAIAAIAALPLLRRLAPALRWTAGAVLFAILVVPAAVTTWPVRWQRPQSPFFRPVMQTCDGLRGRPAVIVVGNYESITLQQTLRSWCGVPVAAQGSAVDTATVKDLAGTLKQRGYDLYLVGTNRKVMDSWAAVIGGKPVGTAGVDDRFTVEETLDRPPDDYADEERVLPLPSPFRIYRLPVPPIEP